MSITLETLKKRVESKKRELEKNRDNFRVLLESELYSGCFERNAINDLMIIMNLRTEIRELERTIRLLESE